MKITAQAAGKAPVNSGTVTAGQSDGHTAVVAVVVAEVTSSDGLFGSTQQLIFFWDLFAALKMGNKLVPCSREVLGERRT